MIKKLFIVFAVVIGLNACSDDWLHTVNKNQLDATTFFYTEKDLDLSVNAAYTPLGHFGFFGNNYFFIFNTLDPYVWFENPFSGFELMQIPKDGRNADMYTALYQGLFRVSDIISKLHQVKDVVPEQKFNQSEAQVRALRAMYYFYLVTIYDRPVYYDETNVPYDANAIFTNGDRTAFWDKIESDLLFAGEHLPAVWVGADKGRIPKGGADALLGKALLYKYYHYYVRFGNKASPEAAQCLDKAKAAFERVINNPDHDLIYPVEQTKEHYFAAMVSNFSYLDVPTEGGHSYKAENNIESLWEQQYNNDDRGGNGHLPAWQWGGHQNYEFFSPLGYRNHEIDPKLWYAFEDIPAGVHPAGHLKDPRVRVTCYLDGDLLDWRRGPDYVFNSATHTKRVVSLNNLYPPSLPSIRDADNGDRTTVALGLKKYYYPQFYGINRAPQSAPQNVRIIRYADVLLMYAETLLQLNNDASGAGLEALNKVRDRAGMQPIAKLTHAAIVHERTVELATEGHTYFDIIRWQFDPAFNINLATLFRGNFVYPKNLYFPIPQAEIDINKGSLIQNPEW